MRKSLVSFANFDASSVQVFIEGFGTDLNVFEGAKTVVEVSSVASVVVDCGFSGPGTSQRRPAYLLGIPEISFFAFAGETGVGVNTVSGSVTGMGSFGTFISWTSALLTISNVPFFGFAFTGVAVGQVGTSGVFVTVVCALFALVDSDGADVAVAYVTWVTLTFVASGDVETFCV